MEAGVHINASCGGEGVCGKCKIILESGELDSQRGAIQTDEEWNLGFRLACQSQVVSDLVVRIPPESLFDKRLLRQKPPGAPLRPLFFDAEELRAADKYDPAFQKKFLQLRHLPWSNNICDLRRLREGLKKQHRLNNITVDFFLTRQLGQVMRENNFAVTATLDFAQRRSRKPRLIRVEPGDTTARHYAIAIDIGTTTVWGQLLDLTGGAIIALSGNITPRSATARTLSAVLSMPVNPKGWSACRTWWSAPSIRCSRPCSRKINSPPKTFPI